jgi:hypothetical protein
LLLEGLACGFLSLLSILVNSLRCKFKENTRLLASGQEKKTP